MRRAAAAVAVIAALLSIGALAALAVHWITPPPSPDMSISVDVAAPGANALEAERIACEPVESALATIERVERIESEATSGHCRTRLVFGRGSDAEAALGAVRTAVGGLELPDIAVVTRDRRSGPLVYFEVDRSGEPAALHARLSRARDALLASPRVRDVTLCGSPPVEVLVAIDPVAATARGVAPSAVVDALQHQDVSLPAGRLDGTREITVRQGDRGAVEALAAIAIGPTGTSLRDIASIATVPGRPDCRCLCGGSPCICGTVEIEPRGGEPPEEAEAAVGRLIGRELTGPPDATVLARERRRYTLAVAAGSEPAQVEEIATSVAATLRALPGAPRPIVLVHGEAGHLEVILGPADGAPDDAAIASALGRLPGVALVDRPGPPVVASVATDDLELAADVAGRVADAARREPGVETVAIDASWPAPELRIEVDRERAARLGVTAADVQTTLELATKGIECGQATIGGRRHPVRVVLRPDHVADPHALRSLIVPGADGVLVPLGDVTTVSEAQAPRRILRTGGRRHIPVRIWLAPGGDASRLREGITRAVELPAGVAVRWEEGP